MSTIAGQYSDSTGCQRSSVAKMLSICRRPENCHCRIEGSGQSTFGWSGVRNPGITRHKGILAAMDGTIYNRHEIGRAENDVELITELYAQFGFVETLRRLNGDFAIALYDPSDHSLWLARDRFGVKPLYYAVCSEYLAFASRPRALLSLPCVSPVVNREYVALFAASHYRCFDNNPERTPYRDISQLPAAQWLRVANGTVSRGSYWSLQDLPDHSEPEDALADRYRSLLIDAVALRMKESSRPAFTLSGGMDSSSVLASAVYVTGNKQHAFSTVYEDKTYDESDDIRSMLDATVEGWHSVRVGRPDVHSLVQRMIDVNDEPVATATWLAHYLLCEEASRMGFDTLFGGLGGDELNAGEYEHFFYYFADLRYQNNEKLLSHEVQMWAHYHDHPIFQKNFQVVEETLNRVVDGTCSGRCLPDERRIRRYLTALNPEYFDLAIFDPVMEHPFQSYLKNRTYQDLTRETIPCCLRAENRQSAAFGLDNRLPFLDHRLVEFMFRIPGRLKYRSGVTKYLLRQAMRGILPEATRTRVKKTGWNAPAHVWFSGKGRELVLDLVHSRAFRERGIYLVSDVLRLIDEHETIVSSGHIKEHHMMFLWQLVNLEMWLQQAETLSAAACVSPRK